MHWGKKHSEDCSCFPAPMAAFCVFVTKCCCSALGPVSSKFTSRMNLDRLDTRKVKVDCSEIPTCTDRHTRSSKLSCKGRRLYIYTYEYFCLYHQTVPTSPKSRVSWWLGAIILRPPSGFSTCTEVLRVKQLALMISVSGSNFFFTLRTTLKLT